MDVINIRDMVVGVSGGLFMLIAFVFFLRLLQAWLLHRTLRDAINRDSAIAGELVDKIGEADRRAPVTQGDDRNGLVLLALGIAMAGFAGIANDPSWMRYGIGAALFPMFVGMALLGRHIWLRRTAERGLADRP